jgi:hypothetical protein
MTTTKYNNYKIVITESRGSFILQITGPDYDAALSIRPLNSDTLDPLRFAKEFVDTVLAPKLVQQ